MMRDLRQLIPKAIILLSCVFVWTVSPSQTVIPVELKNGVYMIPGKVNGLPLKFIFDTGASDVVLSYTEALFMLKNGHLVEEDFTGTAQYRIANGEIHEGYTLNLRSVEIGDIRITNVSATITKSTDSPILLGQSILSRIGNYRFDYTKNTVTIEKSGTKTIDYGIKLAPPPPSKRWLNRELQYGSILDIDGNTYATIQIGTQVWMAENLRTTRFRDGTKILHQRNPQDWDNPLNMTPAWCEYDNREYNALYFGHLYNWHAVSSLDGLCPKGWHVPTSLEWTILINTLGGRDGAGHAFKSSGNEFWKDNLEGDVKNEVGFSALPGGYMIEGKFEGLGEIAKFWSSSTLDNLKAGIVYIDVSSSVAFTPKRYFVDGYSVRCVCDETR